MSASIIPFEPGASLARIAATPGGWRIDCRSSRSARVYDFTSAGEAAEFAVILRDDGDWLLRFGSGSEPVRAIVDEIGTEGEG